MTNQTIKLYHGTGSPNSRRVRIYLAEKGVTIPLVAVDLSSGEQHGEAYRAINPRRVVPALVLEDGTVIGEVPAIIRYIEEIHPAAPLLGDSAKEKAQVAMWERRAELDGFAAVMEAVRNAVPGLKGRAIAGPHDYGQIPALAERSRLRVTHFLSDLNARLAEVPYVAGERFSMADITALAAVDFAAKALDMQIPAGYMALERWHDSVAARPSASA
jgi:glutathione S-transferase